MWSDVFATSTLPPEGRPPLPQPGLGFDATELPVPALPPPSAPA